MRTLSTVCNVIKQQCVVSTLMSRRVAVQSTYTAPLITTLEAPQDIGPNPVYWCENKNNTYEY